MTPAEDRREDRRLRGRLLAPVTVWTASHDGERAGLTVSSVTLAEGEPALLLAVIDPLSSLHEVASTSGRALVHVLNSDDERLGRLFAGHYPTDPFTEIASAATEHGPRLEGERTVVAVSGFSSEEAGFQSLVRVQIDSVDFARHHAPPLGWYRGGYASPASAPARGA